MTVTVSQTRAFWSSFRIPQRDGTRAIMRTGAPTLTPEGRDWLTRHAGHDRWRILEVPSEEVAIIEIENDGVADRFRTEMCIPPPAEVAQAA